jgi:hypothetical protein
MVIMCAAPEAAVPAGTQIDLSAHIWGMSKDIVLTPEDFVITTGEEPEDWPELVAPGSFVKVVTNGEGLWTKVVSDDGETIQATMANNPFGDFAVFGDLVEYKRENIRDIQAPTYSK